MSTHSPATRAEFKALVLRRLGDGLIQVNVSDDQVEDTIEEALKYYSDYHFDGSEHVFYLHTVTAQNIIDRSITLPAGMLGIKEVYGPGLGGAIITSNSSNFMSHEYQMAWDMTWNNLNGSMLSVYLNQQAMSTMASLTTGMIGLRFSRHSDTLHIDIDWSNIAEGSKIAVEGYSKITPELFPDVWNDRWLIRYTAALLKKVWGQNLSKFEGVMLPGNVTFNGSKIYDDAVAEIQSLEDDMATNYSLGPLDMVG